MKKILRAIAAFAAMGVLTACGNKDTSALVYVTDFKPGDYVTLGEYRGLEIAVDAPAVTEEDVEVYVNSFLIDNGVAPDMVTGRSVKVGDTANIDYEGKLDGVAFAGGTAKGTDLLIGSGQFIPGFEEGVVGMETGETKDIDLAFPDPYRGNPDLSGKEVVFTVTLNHISVPELTDEFVEGLAMEGCVTSEDFRKYVYDGLMEQEQAAYEQEKINAAVAAAEENADFKTPPEGMVNRMNENLNASAAAYAQMYGMGVGDYVAYGYGGTAENYKETLLARAGEMAQTYILLAAIADKEGIAITDAELDELIAQEAQRYGYESTEKYRETIDVEAYREYQLVERVMEFLEENAVVK